MASASPVSTRSRMGVRLDSRSLDSQTFETGRLHTLDMSEAEQSALGERRLLRANRGIHPEFRRKAVQLIPSGRFVKDLAASQGCSDQSLHN
jgi:hypothetical protein